MAPAIGIGAFLQRRPLIGSPGLAPPLTEAPDGPMSTAPHCGSVPSKWYIVAGVFLGGAVRNPGPCWAQRSRQVEPLALPLLLSPSDRRAIRLDGQDISDGARDCAALLTGALISRVISAIRQQHKFGDLGDRQSEVARRFLQDGGDAPRWRRGLTIPIVPPATSISSGSVIPIRTRC
jgi:hypothetical protein